MSHPVTSRILKIEDALAEVLKSGDFDIVHNSDGERCLRPILWGQDKLDVPLLNLGRVARDLERLLS